MENAEHNQPYDLPPADQTAGQPEKENKFLSFLKNGILIVALIVVVVLSFWVSFQLGKRVFLGGSKFEEQKIHADIPEPPPSIKSLQKLGIKVPDETKTGIVSTEAKIAIKAEAVSPVQVTSRIKTTRPKKTATSGYHYKLQAGLFDEINAAHDLSTAIQAAGFDVFVKKVGGKWRVQAGAFNSKKQALNMKSDLVGKGFKVRIVYE